MDARPPARPSTRAFIRPASRTAGRRKLAGQGGWPKFPEHAVALPTTSVPKHLLFGSMQRSALQSKQRNCSFLGMRVRKQKYEKYGGLRELNLRRQGSAANPCEEQRPRGAHKLNHRRAITLH